MTGPLGELSLCCSCYGTAQVRPGGDHHHHHRHPHNRQHQHHRHHSSITAVNFIITAVNFIITIVNFTDGRFRTRTSTSWAGEVAIQSHRRASEEQIFLWAFICFEHNFRHFQKKSWRLHCLKKLLCVITTDVKIYVPIEPYLRTMLRTHGGSSPKEKFFSQINMSKLSFCCNS